MHRRVLTWSWIGFLLGAISFMLATFGSYFPIPQVLMNPNFISIMGLIGFLVSFVILVRYRSEQKGIIQILTTLGLCLGLLGGLGPLGWSGERL